MKRAFVAVLAAAGVGLVTAAGPAVALPAPAASPPAAAPASPTSAATAPAASPATASSPVNALAPERIVLQTNAGDIVLGLYPNAAPKTVAHVLDLARSGALDGADFFRVVPGFVAQVDVNQRATPLTGAAKAAASRTVPLEIAPGLHHERGVLSMAHYDGKPNSGGTGFSVLLGAAPSLDRKFTIFGDVEHGMDVVEEMASAPLSGSSPIFAITISHAIVTDATGLAALTLHGPIPLGAGTTAGPVSSWPRLLLSTSMGDVVVTLSPRDAPEHMRLLQSLVASGAYDNAYVGRADPSGYVQVFAGGSGAAGTPLPVERGAVGNVAGALSIDSTDHEQAPALTLLLSDNHALDGRFTAVGWVTEGSDVLAALARVPTGSDHRPRQTLAIQRMSIVPAGTTLVVRGLVQAGGTSTAGTPWGALGFLLAAGVLGFLIFVFSKRLTPPITASAGLLVVAFAFVGLWVGLVPHAAESSQWLGLALFGGAIGLFRLMGRFERGRPVPPVAAAPAHVPDPPTAESAPPEEAALEPVGSST